MSNQKHWKTDSQKISKHFQNFILSGLFLKKLNLVQRLGRREEKLTSINEGQVLADWNGMYVRTHVHLDNNCSQLVVNSAEKSCFAKSVSQLHHFLLNLIHALSNYWGITLVCLLISLLFTSKTS